MKKIAIIGGGASGVFCGIFAKTEHSTVTIFEKNEKLMKKLFITGKGRCNLTNNCTTSELLESVISNPKFLMSAFSSFSASDTMSFFENASLPLKTERGGRVFPLSDKSSDVIKVLTKTLERKKVVIKTNSTVSKITPRGDKFLVLGEEFDFVVIATGGVTYPLTGSTGDGYLFAKSFGHTVTSLEGGLVGLSTRDNSQDLAGLTLKNVTLNVEKNGKKIFSQMGEVLFTHKGVSGPLVLSASSFLKNEDMTKLKFFVDLKPALSSEELDKRLQRDFEQFKNKDFSNSLSSLLPAKLQGKVVTLSKIPPYKKVNEITKKERQALVEILKEYPLLVSGKDKIDFAIITQGGVSVKEISPKTFESKTTNNLFFIGEVLDVDALTGGFNLQIAFSSGHSAGVELGKRCEEDNL